METDVLIVGGGSRALILLERLATALAGAPEQTLKVIVAEPGVLGPGLHRTDQRPYITFNSPNTCPTIFVNQRVPGLKAAITGLSFAEWQTQYEGKLPAEMRPRAVAGNYLSWSAQHLLKNLPPNLRVEHVADSIVEAARPAGGRLEFQTAGSTKISARAAVVAVGHSFSEARRERLDADAKLGARIISNPFPTHERLKHFDRRHTIAIRGLGLTALDVLAELTIGRGGRFDPATSRYIASGEEPRVYLYSRSSCPIRARPVGADGGSTPFVPVILTPDRAAQVLELPRPIEFRTAVFPLILAELGHRFLSEPVHGVAPELLARMRSWFAAGGAARSNAEVCEFFLAPNIYGPLFELIRPVLRDGIPGTKHLAMAFLRDDVRECRLGIEGSRLKYALEALIEARVFVKGLVDYQHDRFSDPQWIFRTFASLVNRNCIGPQVNKSAELLALLESGLVELAPAGSSVTARDGALVLSEPGIAVDALIRADHVNYATPPQARFIQSLISTGLALPVQDPEGGLIGLKIDETMRLYSRDRQNDPPLWGIGPICEGSSYYNGYVPCIQPDAEYPYFEADRIARGIVEIARTK